MKNNIIPIEALFDDYLGPNLEIDHRKSLHRADLIFGVDVMTQHKFLVFGRKTLENIVRTNTGEELRTVYITLDQDTEELEKLIALVQVIKGYDDYQSADGK